VDGAWLIKTEGIQRYREIIKRSKGINVFRIFLSSRRLYLKATFKKPKLFLQLIIGTLDYHSIFRLLATKSLVENLSPTVDIGAANGIMTIELTLTEFNKSMVNTLVYDRKDVANLNLKLTQLKIKNVTVQQDDAQYLRTLPEGYAKQLMLLDVLEHVEDDNLAIAAAYRTLEKGGVLLISVPTPYYRNFFGAKFDDYIGHRRHYLFEDLKRLLDRNNFKIQEFFYYMSGTPSHICTLLYGKLTARKKSVAIIMELIKAALFPMVALIGLSREMPSRKIQNHSSLIVMAVKE